MNRKYILASLVAVALLVGVASMVYLSRHEGAVTSGTEGAASTSLMRSILPKSVADKFAFLGHDTEETPGGGDADSMLVDALLHGRLEQADSIAKALLENKQLDKAQKQALLLAALHRLKGRDRDQARILDYLSMLSPTSLARELAGELLQPSNSAEVRAAAARTIGTAFVDPSPNGADQTPEARANNAAILEALRAGIASSDRKVAVSSLLTFSRIGPTDEVTKALLALQERQWINRTDAVRELLIQIPAAKGAEEQLGLVKTVIGLSESAPDGDLPASNVVSLAASLLSGADAVSTITPSARRALGEYLVKHEPPIVDGSGNPSVASAFSYANWLLLTAQLNSNGAAEANAQVLAALQTSADPRRVVAVLGSPNGQGVAAAVNSAELDWLRAQVNRAAQENQNSQAMVALLQPAAEAIAAADRSRR